MTSSFPDDQSTAARSWASSSSETKSSTRTNPCGNGTDASSSHGTAHTHTNKAECTCSKWGFCVCRCLTLIYSTYPSWQNSGTAWRCSLHTVYFLHWAGCELSEHNLQTWNSNARCSWAKYSKVWTILERLERSVCGTCMWRRRRACEVAWPVSPDPPSLSRRLTAPCDWRRSPGRHLPPPNSAKELQVIKK